MHLIFKLGKMPLACGLAAASLGLPAPTFALSTVFYETMETVANTTTINAHQSIGGFDNFI